MRHTIVFPRFSVPFLCFWLAGCAGLPSDTQSLRVNLVSMRVVDMQLFEQRYALSIRIQNPNPRELRVAGLDFSLSINGESFADGVSNREIVIPAFSEEVTEIEVSSTLFKLIDQVRTLEQKADEGFDYRLSGSVALSEGWIRIPFEREGTIRLTPSRRKSGSS